MLAYVEKRAPRTAGHSSRPRLSKRVVWIGINLTFSHRENRRLEAAIRGDVRSQTSPILVADVLELDPSRTGQLRVPPPRNAKHTRGPHGFTAQFLPLRHLVAVRDHVVSGCRIIHGRCPDDSAGIHRVSVFIRVRHCRHPGRRGRAVPPANGDGTFGAPTDVPGLSWVHGVDVADIDRDGDFDFLAADGISGAVYLYRNEGAGTFAPRRIAVVNVILLWGRPVYGSRTSTTTDAPTS